MKNIFISISCFICFTLILSSCRSQETSNEELRDEVIAIHDEVMPKMGDLKSLRKEILKISEALQEEDTVANSEKIRELSQLADRMDQAFDGMFVWMRQYKPSSEEMSDEEYRNYLLDQKDKVKKVNEDIKESMAEARNVLGKKD
ncbi:hypothetical protein [Arthrospiribacter ruber]|uniref:Viral A-type inclusion protein n=1 Tax=Arthrospiribacter ruber TaxID=2487934 RepID=A0A951J4S4_9BACT|nr:hypothetical protein [Arthrospiribacter ruber]MBW3469988.1 hypothetical protein [Arthrospiribacter ruber]